MTNNIEFAKEYCGSRIYIKRDDKLPFSFGGNKVRISEEIFRKIREENYNAVITYGSPTSNMNRAAADMAKREGIRCYAIVKLETEGEGPEVSSENREIPENEVLTREAGAEIVYCVGNRVRECVESVMQTAKERGEKAFYIYGDSSGKGNEVLLMQASYKEYAEILEYEHSVGESFDAIVLTVGTAMTISGLTAAELESRREEAESVKPSRIVGISAARTAKKNHEVIAENLKLFTGKSVEEKQLPRICDEYLCGAYGLYNEEVESVIIKLKEECDIPLDPVYTGKSFAGLLQEIEKGNISGKILFIHTGGYPLYLDWLCRR